MFFDSNKVIRHMKKIVVVLGMHRSGTSLVTRGMVVLGFNPGRNLMQPDDDNIKGYWEDVDIYSLNQKIFKALSFRWFDLDDLRFDRFSNLLPYYGINFFDEAVELIEKRFLLSDNIVIKDPRINLLIPFWEKVFEHFGVEVDYVYVLRSPLEVARSLEKRNSIPIKDGVALWSYYNLAALKNISKDFYLISYSDFLDRPNDVFENLSQKLLMPLDASAVIEFVDEFIDTSLRHHVSEEGELDAAIGDFSVASELYSKLKAFSNDFKTSSCDANILVKELLKNASLTLDTSSEIYQFKLYVDTGDGFNEGDSIVLNFIPGEPNFGFDLSAYVDVRALRLFLGKKACVCWSKSVKLVCKSGIINSRVSGGNYFYCIEDKYYFLDQDPYFDFDVTSDDSKGLTLTLELLTSQEVCNSNLLYLSGVEINSLQSEIEIGASSVVELSRVIEEKAHRIGFVEEILKKKDDRIFEKDELIKEYSGKIDSLHKDVQAGSACIVEIEQDLVVKKVEFENLQVVHRENLEEKRQLASELVEGRHALQGKASKYRDLLESVRQLEAKLENGCTELLNSESECRGLQDENQLFAAELAELRTTLLVREDESGNLLKVNQRMISEAGSRDEELLLLARDLEHKDRFTSDRLFEKDQLIVELTRKVESKDDRIYEKDCLIVDWTSRLGRMESEVCELHETLSTKDAEIIGLQNNINSDIRSMLEHERKKMLDGNFISRLLVPLYSIIKICFSLGEYKKYRKDRSLVLKSGFYDQDYYLLHNRDVMLSVRDPLEHFVLTGGREERSPSDWFDSAFYLKTYEDVRESDVNPLVHYLKSGKYEYRARNFSEYQQMMDRLDMSGLAPEYASLLLPRNGPSGVETLIENSGLFDREYYLSKNLDVMRVKVDPVRHYIEYGWREGRNPSAEFDTNYYLKHNVSCEGNPLIHFIESAQSADTRPKLITPGQFTAIDNRLVKPVMLDDGFAGRNVPTTDAPLVSIIVSAYNHWNVTANCIAAIVENTSFEETPYEVILADDCSSDDTLQAEELFPGVNVIRTPHNMGYLRNNNHAVKVARGKFIVLLNNDTQVQRRWLVELVNTFSKHPDAGLVGSLLCTPEGLCMDSGNMIKRDASGDCIGRGFNPDHHSFCYVRECHYVTAACMMVRRSVWEEIGGYDERYAPAYCEDADFGLEVWKLGYKVLVQPFSRVVHLENISHGSTAKERIMNQTGKLHDKWKEELVSHPAGMNNIFLDKDLSANKKTIVVVEGWVPAWDTNAGARSFLMFIKLKKALGYNVKLVFLYDYPEDYLDYILEYQKLGFEVWHSAISDVEWREWLYVRKYAIDAVFVHRPDVADIVFDWVRNNLQRPIIYFNHDLHFLRMQREKEAGSLNHSEENIALYRNKELRYLSESSISLSPSLFEVETLQDSYGINNCVFMPLFVYEEEEEVLITAVDTKNIIFVAGFGHPPNSHGCMWFIENVWEVVKSSCPEVILHIVGSNPGPEILQLNGIDGVVVHGFVSDEALQQMYSNSRLAVIPLLSGAGLKGKLVEAMYRRIPVVGTYIALEGCPDIEKVCSPCDLPEEFAADILRLLGDDGECERRARAGFELINNHFSEVAGLKKMKEIVEVAIDDKKVPAPSERISLLEKDKNALLKLNHFDVKAFAGENNYVYVTGMHPEYYYYLYSKHKIPFAVKHAMVISPVSTEFGQGNSLLTKVLTTKLKEMGYVIHFLYCPTDKSDVLDNGRQMPWDFVYTLADGKNKLLQLKKDKDGAPLANAHLVDDWFTDELNAKVIEIAADYDIDVCLCNYIWLSKALTLLPDTTLKVLETHDKFSFRDTDEYVLAGQSHSGWYSTVPEEEKKGLERADHILAVQEEDANFFGTLVDDSKVAVVGCTLPENYLESKPVNNKMVIGYIAGVNAFNIDQVKKLYTAWEKRPEMLKNTELYIAGSIGVWLQKNNPLPKAKVEGFLGDISEFYDNCHVIVNPDFGGTGIKIKCLEALSFGRPLIASERSMNGIESDSPYHKVQNMEHLLNMVQKLCIESEECLAQAEMSKNIYRNYVSQNDFSVLLRAWVENG